MKLQILYNILYGQDTINNKEIANNKDKYKREGEYNKLPIKDDDWTTPHLVVDDRNNWDNRDNNEIIIMRFRDYNWGVVIEAIIKVRNEIEIKLEVS